MSHLYQYTLRDGQGESLVSVHTEGSDRVSHLYQYTLRDRQGESLVSVHTEGSAG